MTPETKKRIEGLAAHFRKLAETVEAIPEWPDSAALTGLTVKGDEFILWISMPKVDAHPEVVLHAIAKTMNAGMERQSAMKKKSTEEN